MRIAILDDYQRVALASADWSRLGASEVRPFHGHIADGPAFREYRGCRT